MSHTYPYNMHPTHAISIFSSVSNNCRFFSTPVFWAKADAKIQPFSKLQNFFFNKISQNINLRCSTDIYKTKKITEKSKNRRKNRENSTGKQKKQHSEGKKHRNQQDYQKIKLYFSRLSNKKAYYHCTSFLRQNLRIIRLSRAKVRSPVAKIRNVTEQTKFFSYLCISNFPY